MIFFVEDGEVYIGKSYEPSDEVIVCLRNRHGNWLCVLEEILLEYLDRDDIISDLLTTVFARWGFEEFQISLEKNLTEVEFGDHSGGSEALRGRGPHTRMEGRLCSVSNRHLSRG